jgi:bifunctional non-homologous end joining protein LigD
MPPSVGTSWGPAPVLLPEFIPPMLAESGEAFDSDEYSFEIKWDGTRAIAYVDRPGGYRMLNRRRIDVTGRYPEFEVLGSLPPGTVLDGEIVMFKDGKPDFQTLKGREHSRNTMHIRFAAARNPATFVAFDLMFVDFRSVMDQPLVERREALRHLVETINNPRLVFSDAVVGAGKAYFEAACQQGLEGLMAKRLDSRYLPGKRTDCWIKIKRQQTCVCVVIGFVPEGKDDIGSLLVAIEDGGKIVYVGRVGSGMSTAQRHEIRATLDTLIQDAPVIECKHKGAVWVRPAVYCKVRCMERTSTGHLRAPVFVEVCHVGD